MKVWIKYKSTQNHIESIPIPGWKYLESYRINIASIAHPYYLYGVYFKIKNFQQSIH